MNVDVVVGNRKIIAALAPRFTLAPATVLVSTPLEAVERLLEAKLDGRVSRLRIFDAADTPGARVATVHLCRLRGLFQPGGRLELYLSGDRTGQVATAVLGVDRLAFQGGGGFNFQGGSQQGSPVLSEPHVSALLGVTVRVMSF